MRGRRLARWLALGALAVGAAALLSQLRAPPAAGSDAARAPGAPPGRRAQRMGAQLVRQLAAAPDARADRGHERPTDGRPHPISPEHRRLYRDVDLLRAADAEIRAGRFDAARALIAQHRSELGGMSAQEEEGLLLLADCAERPTAANVARVRRFYDAHTDSMLRRRLRRACLERQGSAPELQ